MTGTQVVFSHHVSKFLPTPPGGLLTLYSIVEDTVMLVLEFVGDVMGTIET
jgi:hypothetical protein